MNFYCLKFHKFYLAKISVDISPSFFLRRVIFICDDGEELFNMADVADCGSVAPGIKHWPREKPTIYKTIDGQVIIEDEFLNFLMVKIKTMTQDELVLVASEHSNQSGLSSPKRCCLNFVLIPNNGAWALKANRRTLTI